MNIKHNKKRNTAFLYEILVKEVAKAVYRKDKKYKNVVMEILTKFFSRETEMGKDYLCYRDLYEHKNLDPKIVGRLIVESYTRREKIDRKKLFNEQTKLINKINKTLREDVWDNFVKEYRFLGTLYHYFNVEDLTPKNKVLLEDQIAERLISESKRVEDKIEPIDSITYNIYVNKFNEMFGNSLNDRQKKTIKEYIYSIQDSGTSYRQHLNEELKRLKKELSTTCEGENSICDLEINNKINEVKDLLESYASQKVDIKELTTQVLKVQKLLEEMAKQEEDEDLIND